jgi:predicted adenylyl cyclase CyaB
MPRNIEIKASIADVAALVSKVQAIADQGPFEIIQDDTFFECATGRLKLRAFSAEDGELIYYRRSDERGPKESSYVRASTSAPDSLRLALTLAYGQTGRVRKRRTLYLAARTRIHVDQVEGLGDFLELEVVLEDEEPSTDVTQTAASSARSSQSSPGPPRSTTKKCESSPIAISA